LRFVCIIGASIVELVLQGVLAGAFAREGVESSLRERIQWVETQLPSGWAGDHVFTTELREVYRGLWDGFALKGEFAAISESHDRDAVVDFDMLRGEVQAGFRWSGLFWLAEWRGRYAVRDGTDDILTRQQQWGLRARGTFFPGPPPGGGSFQVIPNLYVGFTEAWPQALDRWSGEAELELNSRITSRFSIILAPRLEWNYFPRFGATDRQDIIESMRLTARLRLDENWALLFDAQVARTESDFSAGDNLAVSVTPQVQSVVKW
jgi:hypothetical protein